jgi:ATP-dependent Clp protease protease subunit
VLLSAGQKGKRFSLPNATIHMHQALGGGSGQASDVQIQAQELMRNNQKIRQILADATDQPMERIERDTDRDFYMSAQEALEYGLVDEVLSKPSE